MQQNYQQLRNPKSLSDRAVGFVTLLIVTAFALMCLIPFIFVLSASFSLEEDILRGGISFIPAHFTTAAYEVIFAGDQIWTSYRVSIAMTAGGTVLSLIFTALFAYPLSTGRLRFGGAISLFIYFTMIFSGGLVPTYMWYSKYLKLSNTIWVLILPSLLIPWNMFLLRNFFASIPQSLSESARIDGANELRILFRIILPVALPALATVGLFYALGYWNEWFRAMLYNASNKNAWPLQFLIMQMMRKVEVARNMVSEGLSISTANLPATTMKMATAICTIGPIVLLYPLAQRYFTSGIMVGSVKG